MAGISIESEIAKNARIANMMMSHLEKSDKDVFIPENYKIARESALDIINSVSDDMLTTFKYSKKFLSKMSDSDKKMYNNALSTLAMLNKPQVYKVAIQTPYEKQKEILKKAGIKYNRGLLSFISTNYRDLFAILSYSEIKEKTEQNEDNNFSELMADIYSEISKNKQEELKQLNELQKENVKRYGKQTFSAKQLSKNPEIAKVLKGITS